MNKINKKDVKTGLEICFSTHECNKCPYWCNNIVCKTFLIEDAIALLQEENESYKCGQHVVGGCGFAMELKSKGEKRMTEYFKKDNTKLTRCRTTQKDAIEAMKSIAKFINDALELTKSENPNSYDEEVFQELSEQCITVLTHLKQESE